MPNKEPKKLRKSLANKWQDFKLGIRYLKLLTWKERWKWFVGKIKHYMSWRSFICFAIAWVLIDGSPYIMIILGLILHNSWLLGVGATIEAILWMPWTLEKPFVIVPLGVVFYNVSLKLVPPQKKPIKKEVTIHGGST